MFQYWFAILIKAKVMLISILIKTSCLISLWHTEAGSPSIEDQSRILKQGLTDQSDVIHLEYLITGLVIHGRRRLSDYIHPILGFYLCVTPPPCLRHETTMWIMREKMWIPLMIVHLWSKLNLKYSLKSQKKKKGKTEIQQIKDQRWNLSMASKCFTFLSKTAFWLTWRIFKSQAYLATNFFFFFK